jgi:uncharacterized protein
MVNENKNTNDNGYLFAMMFVVFVIGVGVGLVSSGFVFKTGSVGEKNFSVEESVQPIVLNEGSKTAVANVVAVTSDGTGLLGKVNIEMTPGKGRVLINTNPFIEPDTQYSAETARDVAAVVSGKNLSEFDIIFSFNLTANEGSMERGAVGGPSAGIALATAIIAAAEGRSVRSDVVMTGTINKDGSIGQIGGVFEKAEAAGKLGMKTFIVPAGQVSMTYYEKAVEEKRAGGFYIQTIRYVPRTMNLNNYTMQQWNMTTMEVANIYDSLEYSLE